MLRSHRYAVMRVEVEVDARFQPGLRWGMRRRSVCGSALLLATLIVAGSCAGQRAKPDSAPTAEQIVRSMVAAYERATSYEDHGVSDTRFISRAPHTNHGEFDTAFARGGGFRHEARDKWAGSPTVAWMEAGKLRSYRRGGTIADKAFVGGPRFYSAVPRILLPAFARDNGMSDFKTLRIDGRAEVVDGHPCWRIVGVRASGEQETLWVDQASFLLRRTVTREHYPSGIESEAFDTETTTTYSPVVNAAISASRLAGPDPATIPRPPTEPWIGVELAADAARIVRVLSGTPADRAGVQAGDELVSLDGAPLPDSSAFIQQVQRKGVGATVTIVIRRGGLLRSISVEVGDRWAHSTIQRDLIDKPAPPFAATAINGAYPASLSGLSGQLIVLDFTPPTFVRCENCETPAGTFMNKLQEKYGRRGLRVVGVSATDASTLQKVANDLGLKYALVHDRDDKIANAYLVQSPMTTIVIDRAGIVRFVTNRTGLEVLIEHLLESGI